MCEEPRTVQLSQEHLSLVGEGRGSLEPRSELSELLELQGIGEDLRRAKAAGNVLELRASLLQAFKQTGVEERFRHERVRDSQRIDHPQGGSRLATASSRPTRSLQEPFLPYFRLNRSTRPAVSTSLCFPV